MASPVELVNSLSVVPPVRRPGGAAARSALFTFGSATGRGRRWRVACRARLEPRRARSDRTGDDDVRRGGFAAFAITSGGLGDRGFSASVDRRQQGDKRGRRQRPSCPLHVRRRLAGERGYATSRGRTITAPSTESRVRRGHRERCSSRSTGLTSTSRFPFGLAQGAPRQPRPNAGFGRR